VSVCVPAYRAEQFLGATIESVLAQTFTDWELIVLDNASPDRTGEIARSYSDPRIRVLTNPGTVPLADNWNAVAAQARAPYMKLLCADDLIEPACLAAEVDILDRYPGVAMVASRRDFISADGQVVLRDRGLNGLIGMRDPAEVIETVVRSGINPIGWPSALLVRRADFEAVGGFDPRWLHPIDLDLWLRLLSCGSLYGLDRSLASFRISGQSVTARIGDSGAQHRQVLRAFARETPWKVSRWSLARGGIRSRLEQVRLRLLFAAVNSGHRWARALPAMVLERRIRPSGLGSGEAASVVGPDDPADRAPGSSGGTYVEAGLAAGGPLADVSDSAPDRPDQRSSA
jgi:glycosyltransferase involved in cell wall biosynthesis